VTSFRRIYHMNSQPRRKTGIGSQFENRRDWVMFSGFARMRVWNSGGPINAPHERVLQLLIKPWEGDDESWTVYRHKRGAGKPGKIVFKKWNSDADKARFRSLEKKAAPKRWCDSVNVDVMQYPLSGRWVGMLEKRIESLSVPPIAGPVKPLAREAEYTLSLWRNRQEARFSWNPTPPAAWRPLSKLFSVLLREFRRHAGGKPLNSVQQLWPTKQIE
jgi:hypothetical protein